MTPIPLFKVAMHPGAGYLVAKTLESGYVGEGKQVARFERELGREFGLDPHPLAVNSCTAAIDLALHLIGVGPGDEVITTPMTCSATNGPIVTRGATPVWADIDPITGLIDPEDVRRRITARTQAIIAVDWGGRSCNYPALKLGTYGIPIIQDAAHRLSVGRQHGDYVCWSFGPIKHLTCGGYGGALLPPANQRDRAKLLRWHGLDRESKADFRCEQNITEVGYRYHLTDDLATVGLANLPLAAMNVEKAREHARFYDRALRNLPGVRLQPFDPACDYWLFTVLVSDRESFIAHLESQGIASSPVHARNDTHSAFRAAAGAQDPARPLVGVDAFSAHEVAIPVGWWLSQHHLEEIAAAVITWSQQYARSRQPQEELVHA